MNQDLVKSSYADVLAWGVDKLTALSLPQDTLVGDAPPGVRGVGMVGVGSVGWQLVNGMAGSWWMMDFLQFFSMFIST